MSSSSALPFQLKRTSQAFAGQEYRFTTERVDGLLRLDGENLVIQWRVARETQRYGPEMRTDQDLDPVREAIIPLATLASAEVRARGRWLLAPRIVLTAADLRAFEEVAGATGLRLDHPATLVLAIRRSDALAAREFAADVSLALAERALHGAESGERLPPGE